MADDVKHMADLLKSGATMLSDICPECGSPLFRIKGEVFCAKCNKPVVYAKATGPQATVSPSHLLESLEQTIMAKLTEA
ncbi:MAG TPA: Sjogren's syndrome/scleroderma autoantigen 1 family protein, partial [Candidatus Bathyarchaeia archaeon]